MKRQTLFVGVLILGLTLISVPLPRVVDAARSADFDGDWYADLAVGVRYEGVGSASLAGAVNVLYGQSGIGLDDPDNQFWYQGGNGLVDTAEAQEAFGSALAVGDFDGDGYTDLAIGVPLESVGSVVNAGAVHVLYGAAPGLAASRNQLLSQDSPGILDDAETDDYLGWVMTVGDFNGDGYDDLAVGITNESIGSPERSGAGAVAVFYGSASGLGGGNQLWHQDVSGIENETDTNDHFGAALAAGDFNGDGYDDLAVGVPFEDIDAKAISNAGAVQVILGSAAGLTAAGSQLWDQDTIGISDAPEAGDGFGFALAAGDLNGDGYEDLAVGVPNEGIGAPDIADAGVLHVIYGSSAGLAAPGGDQLWHQNVTGVDDAAEAGDHYGWTLAVGDFDGDGRADLAVGVPFEDVGDVIDAGAAHVLYGSASGLVVARDQFWNQDSMGISDMAEADDHFGVALTSGDFDGDGNADLVVGVPDEDIGSLVDAGAAHVIYGSTAGLAAPGGDQQWHQNATGIADTAEANDQFGYALAALPRTTHRAYLPLMLRRPNSDTH